jgi:hypothetical protein
LHARVDVLDDVGHLKDAGLRLAESEERHALPSALGRGGRRAA